MSKMNTNPGAPTGSDAAAHGKVGSDPDAAHNVGGSGDFGIPVHQGIERARDGEIEGRPAGSAPGFDGENAGDMGNRTVGTGGRAGGVPGQDSGGDLDPDLIGFGSGGHAGSGLAAKPPRDEEITSANITDGSSDAFASGGHAEGRNSIPRGSHGSAPLVHGDSTDHSGDDTSTTNSRAAGSVNPALRGEEPGGEGEITMDEANGDEDEGAES